MRQNALDICQMLNNEVSLPVIVPQKAPHYGVFLANQMRNLVQQATKLDMFIIIKCIRLFCSSSYNSFIGAWYAPQRCLHYSDTHILTQQELLLFFFFHHSCQNHAGSSDDDRSLLYPRHVCLVLLPSSN